MRNLKLAICILSIELSILPFSLPLLFFFLSLLLSIYKGNVCLEYSQLATNSPSSSLISVSIIKFLTHPPSTTYSPQVSQSSPRIPLASLHLPPNSLIKHLARLPPRLNQHLIDTHPLGPTDRPNHRIGHVPRLKHLLSTRRSKLLQRLCITTHAQ